MNQKSTAYPPAVANCKGVVVPASPFLHEKRIQRINASRYEGQEIAGALHMVQAGDNVLELGAGLGIVGAVVAKNCAPTRVIAFEANPDLIPHIQNLYAMNALNDKICVRNQVLVSVPERADALPFHIHNSYLGSSLDGDPTRAKRTVQIPTADFDAVRQDLKPDVMLIDIEGGEMELLQHACLKGLRAIVIEFHPKAYGIAGMRTCKDILRDAGFLPLKEFSTKLVWVAQRVR